MNEFINILNFDPFGQEKGYPFERFIYLQLQKITEKESNLFQVHFIKKPEEWMKQVEFQIDKFGTFRDLNFSSDIDVIRDLVSGKVKNILLKPQNEMGPDGLWIYVENNIIYFIVIAIKFYTSYSSKAQTKNQLQSNLGHVYLDKHGNIQKGETENHIQFHDLSIYFSTKDILIFGLCVNSDQSQSSFMYFSIISIVILEHLDKYLPHHILSIYFSI